MESRAERLLDLVAGLVIFIDPGSLFWSNNISGGTTFSSLPESFAFICLNFSDNAIIYYPRN
jgi:hypothetical protein